MRLLWNILAIIGLISVGSIGYTQYKGVSAVGTIMSHVDSVMNAGEEAEAPAEAAE